MGLFYSNQPFAFGESVYRNGGIYGPLSASSVNLMVVVEGSADLLWDGFKTHIQAGQVALIYNRGPAEFRYPKGVTTVVRWCETGELTGSARIKQKLSAASGAIKASKSMLELMRIALEHWTDNREPVRAFRDALGEALVCSYLYESDKDRDEAIIPGTVAKAKDYIDVHFCEPIDCELIARRAGISSKHLVALFKEHFGISPVKYLWSRRAEKGAHLLRETELTVGEIAYMCGYKNPFHFSRQVKVVFGKSPSDLRSHQAPLQPSSPRTVYVPERPPAREHGLAVGGAKRRRNVSG